MPIEKVMITKVKSTTLCLPLHPLNAGCWRRVGKMHKFLFASSSPVVSTPHYQATKGAGHKRASRTASWCFFSSTGLWQLEVFIQLQF